MALTDRDRLAVRDALDEILSNPPRDLAPIGCLVALPGLLILFVVPVLGRQIGLVSGVATVAIVLGIALLVGGVTAWAAAPGLIRGHSKAAREAALRQLEQGDDDREVLLRAATLLLAHAHATVGATTAVSLDLADARRRVDDRLPLVVDVERFLLAEEEIYPVFTRDEAESGPS